MYGTLITTVNNIFHVLQEGHLNMRLPVIIRVGFCVYSLLHFVSLNDSRLNERSTHTLTEPHIKHTHTNVYTLRCKED